MSDYEIIPQQAIDTLLADPNKAAGFDQVFGAGRAAEVLASRHPVPEAEPQETPEMGFWGKVWDSTGRAVTYGAQEAVNETMDAVDSFDAWASRKLDALGVPSRLQITDAEGNFAPALKFTHEVDMEAPSYGDLNVNVADRPETVPGQLVGGISQFAVGFLGAGKLTKLTGLRGAFVNGAIADAVVFDPNDANVMKMLGEWGFDTGAVGEALATNPDDPEYINRLRNVGEGAAFGGIVEAIGWGIKAARAMKAGDETLAKGFIAKQEAALKELDDAIAEAGKETAEQARQTLEMTKQVIEADGQMRLDLGDTPVAKAGATTEAAPGRIYMTPEAVEKIRLQTSLAKGASGAEKQAMFSYRSARTYRDVEQVINDMAGQKAVLADEFTKIKGGDVQRWRTVVAQSVAKARDMAAQFGEDPEALVKRFLEANLGDVSKMAAEVHARERILKGAQQEVQAMGRVIADALSNKPYDLKQFPGIRDLDELRLAFSQAMDLAVNMQAGQDALRSNIARSFNAMKMAKSGDKAMREMLRNPDAFKDIDAVARAVADPANAEVPTVRIVNDTLEALHGFMDGVNTFRINALLSGPGTQEVNVISNMVNSFVIPAEQAIGGMVTGDTQMMRHALRQLQGSVAGMFDFIKTSMDAGWHDEAILDPFSQKIEGDAMVKHKGIFWNTVKIPSRFLMTQDEFFKQSQYRGRVFADAHAAADAKVLRGADREAFIKQYLKESYTDTGAATRGDALLQARRATFTEPLEPGLASTIQAMAVKHPTVRFFIPFVRTPVNILSQTFQHAPALGLASRRMRADLAAGGVRAAQARGRQAVGAALVATAGWLAATGQITGSGPTDPRVRAVWLKNNQPYAFRVNMEDGTVGWVSFARLEPLSNVFSIAADAVEIMSDTYNEAETYNVLQSLAMAVMENTVNKTFTQGIYDAMLLFSGRPHEQERAFRNFVASFVPNVQNQLNGDEALREARTITDAVMARTHLYNGVDPKRNVLGEPILRTLPKYDPLGLTHKDVRVIDKVMDEVTRVAILNQSVSENPSRKVPGVEEIDLSQVPYKKGQSVYDRWIELTGTVKISGKTLREKLEETINSRSYRVAPDGSIGTTDSGTKGAIIRKVIVAYREKAKSELPELVTIIKNQRRGDATFKREQQRSNRELFPITNTPERSIKRRSFEDLLGR